MTDVQTSGPTYPDCVVELIGQDGNAFYVIGLVSRALKKHGVEQSEREEFMVEAMDGDYVHLLQTCMKWVTVE